jgi:hypothetical protein
MRVRFQALVWRQYVPALLFSVLVSGCATVVTSESRSTDGQYDGNWSGTIGETPASFVTQNWRLRCFDPDGRIRMRIVDGAISLVWQNLAGKGYIDQNGKFRIIIPRPGEIKNKPSNKGSLTRGRNFIFAGTLSSASGVGRWTSGYEHLGNQGCSAKVSFEKS